MKLRIIVAELHSQMQNNLFETAPENLFMNIQDVLKETI